MIPSPCLAASLRDRLAAARRHGIDFDEAWRDAVGLELAAVNTRREREAWAEALAATLDAWRRAYADEPLAARDVAARAIARYHDMPAPAPRTRTVLLA